jgi:23S rRNA (cytidine2498-2'-O)-methyltransferase
MQPNLVALAPKDFTSVLSEEVEGRSLRSLERLFLLRGFDLPVFVQNIWLKPELYKFQSISQAAKHLRAIQRNWWLHSVGHHRRASLIQEQLPPLTPKPLEFLAKVPSAPLGAWTLLDEDTLLYSARCSSPFPDGEVEFIENKTDPPSRAYLKLWELFTVLGRHPATGEKVIDLGSAPGGWTWVLDQLGCEVISVDKAQLAEKLKLSQRVQFISESAFSLAQKSQSDVRWLFSDIICYPERLLELIRKWEVNVPNLVCTIKFQGPTNFSIIKDFLKIPGSEIRHLTCNKHELTWFRLQH